MELPQVERLLHERERRQLVGVATMRSETGVMAMAFSYPAAHTVSAGGIQSKPRAATAHVRDERAICWMVSELGSHTERAREDPGVGVFQG